MKRFARPTALLPVVFLCAAYARAQTSPTQDTPPTRLLEVKQDAPVAPVMADPIGGPPVRIIEVYQDAGSTKLVVQSRDALVTGRSLYVGLREEAVTIGPLLSRTAGGAHYYAASAPGKLRLQPGDTVRFSPTAKLTLPEAVLRALSAHGGFEQKAVAEITAVQEDRLMIDKGSLHEVHERDLYRILDASGTDKGTLEVRGIGDFQSSALFHNQKGARSGAGLAAVRPGDYAVLLGQRRLFGLGLLIGQQNKRSQMLYGFDSSSGGGLLWSMTFYNGWGLEALFGQFTRGGNDSSIAAERNVLERIDFRDERSARYILPIWMKKNFFYPSLVSPFAAAGAYLFSGRHMHEMNDVASGRIQQTTTKRFVYPVVGVGIEFFPARFFRPRLEVRQFFGPHLTARGNVFRTNSTFYSIGVLTSW